MSPISVTPPEVTSAHVRRLAVPPLATIPVQHVEVPLVPAAQAVPRQVDPVAERLSLLEQENAELRSELTRLRTA